MLKTNLGLISIVITTLSHPQYTRPCIFEGFRLVGKAKFVVRQIFLHALFSSIIGRPPLHVFCGTRVKPR